MWITANGTACACAKSSSITVSIALQALCSKDKGTHVSMSASGVLTPSLYEPKTRSMTTPTSSGDSRLSTASRLLQAVAKSLNLSSTISRCSVNTFGSNKPAACSTHFSSTVEEISSAVGVLTEMTGPIYLHSLLQAKDFLAQRMLLVLAESCVVHQLLA
jgi:hypothetical protein